MPKLEVEVPRIPFSDGQTQAQYFRSAADHIENGLVIDGANLTQAVVSLLRATGAALDAIVLVKVILFKSTGKYYTEEEWTMPKDIEGPYQMDWSPDFRRIDGGPVLIPSQEPWGYPHLFV